MPRIIPCSCSIKSAASLRSSGSILRAHLVLNWDKYCGSDEDFQQVANDIVRFVQLDVRNRIVRCFPLTSTANMARRLLRMRSNPKLTRPGLLERHYEKFLYGDTGLCELPDPPRLHILSTDPAPLNESTP